MSKKQETENNSKGIKLLLSGASNAGKTSLTKDLLDTLVISHDGKAYPFKVPHGEISTVSSASDISAFVNDKALAYQERFGKMPKTIVFDSVSRIYESLYDACSSRYTGFAIYSNLDREIKAFADFLEEILDSGINLIIISHALYDADEGKFNLVGKGSFSKLGGFLSVVDEGIFIETKNDKRILHFRSTKFPARTLQDDLPNSVPSTDFDLQKHMEMLLSTTADVAEYAL